MLVFLALFHMDLQTDANVLKEHTATIFRASAEDDGSMFLQIFGIYC
jgi:hypothetical protein